MKRKAVEGGWKESVGVLVQKERKRGKKKGQLLVERMEWKK